MFVKPLIRVLLTSLALLFAALAHAQADGRVDYRLGPGDMVRIQVFQQPDLTVEARVSENGVISYPLLGVIRIGGLSPTDVERLIAQRLTEGNFLKSPQVTLNVTQFRSQQVSVLGNVAKPGRYALETTGMRLSEVLSMAGGVTPTGADQVVLMTTRGGRMQRMEIDLVEMFTVGDLSRDMPLVAGDVIFVDRAPQFYVYGQVQRPGMYGLDRGITVAQAIAKGGGLTLRGTDKGVRVHRRFGGNTVQVLEPKLDDLVKPDDLIFVRESVF
ncbi:MAG TPA: polysaccharide export protein EpsE [Burkholderiaceae bacterium]|jgi:polysaccharide export outer membrane protein|nr:polysaccharide export protein EpsE [Burkholderiaceae bacterium]